MKPSTFAYIRPDSLAEALHHLAENGEDAKVLAGGQSLVPMLNMRLLRPAVLIDIGRLADLDGIESRNGDVVVGALATQRALQDSPLVPPLVAEALPHVGHFVTRNRGTVGGSIAHADAAAELPLCLAVLGGSVVAASPRGTREIPAVEFFETHFTTTLAPDELVVETRWPRLDGWSFAFEEFSQRRGDYGLALAAVGLRVENGTVAEARVGIGSVVDRPVLVDTDLVGHAVDGDLARATGEAAAGLFAAFGNLHASPAYERQLIRVCVERAVLRAWEAAA